MTRCAVFILALVGCGSAGAQGFSFGGGADRDYPYANEPQYQYPYTDGRRRTVRPCRTGQALFQGKCRYIRWLPGSQKS